ncbi:unnamed protein product [Caenorhabditis bovis]|uniref:Serpentine receptor class gamma n=1 Tax=Caenorhabditis bovis TaxID=2654633 RepID=A0A8S1F110_9PELO|nr:unnamed protein product [Caenorhabditis bovis]
MPKYSILLFAIFALLVNLSEPRATSSSESKENKSSESDPKSKSDEVFDNNDIGANMTEVETPQERHERDAEEIEKADEAPVDEAQDAEEGSEKVELAPLKSDSKSDGAAEQKDQVISSENATSIESAENSNQTEIFSLQNLEIVIITWPLIPIRLVKVLMTTLAPFYSARSRFLCVLLRLETSFYYSTCMVHLQYLITFYIKFYREGNAAFRYTTGVLSFRFMITILSTIIPLFLLRPISESFNIFSTKKITSETIDRLKTASEDHIRVTIT